jgi:DNA-binding MarR family transcriptional regulator
VTSDHRAHRDLIAESILRTSQLGIRMSRRVEETIGDERLAHNAPVGVLAKLWLERELRPRELAAAVGRTSGGVAKVIDRLESAGMVERVAEGLTDGRAVLVRLTAEGAKVAEAIFDALDPLLIELVEDLRRIRDTGSRKAT